MKRLLALLVVTCLVLVPAAVWAGELEILATVDEEDLFDGSKIIIRQSPGLFDTNEYYADNTAPRTVSGDDLEVGGQEVKVRIEAEALIPCYLRMVFQGNNANYELESFGRGAVTDYDVPSTPPPVVAATMYFAPAIGGYINGNWETIANSTDPNAEFAPGNNIYIRGCDVFRTLTWSNLNYQVSVGLVGANGLAQEGWDRLLPVQMRWSQGDPMPGNNWNGLSWSGTMPLSSEPTTLFTGEATAAMAITNYQFRVPYGRDFRAGTYTGQVLFTAATI